MCRITVIAFIFITGDGFHPIRDGVHIPEDLTQDVQFFCRQRGDFIRRGIIRSRPHRIDGQHIPPVSDYRRIAGIVHIQFIMRVLRLDLLDHRAPLLELAQRGGMEPDVFSVPVDLLTKYGICFPLPESHQSRLFMERRDQSDYKSVEMYC